MIEMAQVNYISNVGSVSKKGFNHYRNFINRMESKKHIEKRNITQVTVWERIERYEEKRSKIKNGI